MEPLQHSKHNVVMDQLGEAQHSEFEFEWLTDQVPLGIQLHNENKLNEMAQILLNTFRQRIQKYPWRLMELLTCSRKQECGSVLSLETSRHQPVYEVL